MDNVQETCSCNNTPSMQNFGLNCHFLSTYQCLGLYLALGKTAEYEGNFIILYALSSLVMTVKYHVLGFRFSPSLDKTTPFHTFVVALLYFWTEFEARPKSICFF
jgi:hypothetical protein